MTTINHQFSPATTSPGDSTRYSIIIANSAAVGLTQADVTVALPSQIALAVPPNFTNTCGFSGIATGTASNGDMLLILTGGTIPPKVGSADGQCAFQADVTSVSPGNWVSTIPANTTPNATTSGYTAFENGAQIWNATQASATLSVDTLLNPTGSKSFSPSSAKAGDPVTLTLVLSNPNPGATLPLTTVTDNLPASGGVQMVVANPASPTVSCTGTGAVAGTVLATPGDSAITLSGGVIGESGSCTVTVRVTVPVLAAGATTASFTNTLPSGAIGNSRGLTSPAFNRGITIASPITVAKSFATSPIAAGQPSLMTLAIGNTSTANTLPITSFTDAMGANFKILTTASTPVAAPADPAVVCSGVGATTGTLTAIDGAGTLSLDNAIAGPSGACTITAYVTSSVDGTQTNSIPAGAVINPAGHTSPAASAGLVVNAQITVSKTASVTNLAPGQWTTFTVTINNWSGADVTSTTFTDTLPQNGANQMVLDTSAAPTASCGGSFTGNDGDPTLVWNGTLPAGSGPNPGVCTITFRARLPATAASGMSFTNSLPGNTAVIGTGNGPGGQVINTNSAAQNVSTIYSADIAKSFAPTSIAQGGLSLLTVTIYNRTLTPLTNIALTDTLPAGLSLAPNPNASTTCNAGATPSLQAFPGGNQLVLSNGGLAARPDASQQSSCYFRAYVTGASLGSHTNQIAAGAMTTSGPSNGSSVSATLTITTGLSGSKTFAPTSVSAGGTTRVRITVTNTSSASLSNISVNDSGFSTGLSVANPANAATSCAGAPTLVVNPGATSAQLLGATLAAGASCDFSFDVTAAGSGPWSNTIPIGNITSAEGPANTAPVTATLAVATALIGINKSFNPVVMAGGVPSRLTIDVVNNSSVAVHDVGFTDTFPNGMQVYLTPNASTNCAGGTVTAVPGSGFVTLAGATLAPTSTCHVYLDVTSVKFLNLTNTIPAGAISSAEGYTNAAGTVVTLSTLQGLGLMKGFAPAYVGPGNPARLKLRLVSTYDPNALNPVILNNATFTDTLPAGMTFATPANATTDCPGPGGTGIAGVLANTTDNTLTLSGATISPATNCAIEADVVVNVVGAYNNVIPQEAVTTTEGVTNPVPANAWLYAVTSPTIGKAFASSPINPGAVTTLTVTVTNNSAAPLTGVALTDTLPAGLAIAGTPNAATTCAGGIAAALAGDNELSISGATIPANGSCTLSAQVVGNTPGSYTNTIAAGRLSSDQGLTNPNSPSATLEVRNPPTIAKSFAPASIAVNGISTLTITLTNPNANAITLSSALVDALPGNVVVASPANAGKTCSGGTLTAQAGATGISYSGGTIPAGGSCTLYVDVTSAVGPAAYTNLIPVGALVTNAGSNAKPAAANLGVGQPAAPTLDKSFSPGTIALGGTATLTITLGNGNLSPLTLTGDLVDTLPANLALAPPLTLGGTCPGPATGTAGGTTITYGNGATIPGGGCTITAQVTSSVAGSYTNTLAAGALVTDGGANPLPATAGLVVQAMTPPGVQKSYSLGTINPGGTTRMTISLENANPVPLLLTADFVDTLPPQLSVAAPANIGGSCAGTIIATAGGATVTYANGAGIPAGGCTIEVDLTSMNSGGPYTNTIAAGSLQTSAGNNGAPANANLFVNPSQPPSITKTFTPAIIPINGVSRLTIGFANGNLAPATLSADLVDPLPAGLTVANPPNIQATAGCSIGRVTAVAGATSVTYASGATLPANGGCSIAVDVTAATVATYTNTIAIGALQTDLGANNIAATAGVQVLNGPGLSKSFAPASVLAGAPATLTLSLANTNATPLTLTQALVDTLPTGLVVANPATIGGSCTGAVTAIAGAGTVIYAQGAGIPSGGCTITVPVVATVGGVYTNVLAAGALHTDGGNSPGPATASLTVLGRPSVAKAFSPAAIPPGAKTRLTISLVNGNGVSAILDADLVDTLPAGLTVANPPDLGGTCPGMTAATAGGNTVTYPSGASIPPGGCTISVSLVADAVKTYTNTIAAGALTTDAGSNAQPAAAVLSVVIIGGGIPALSDLALAILSVLMLVAGYRRSGKIVSRH